MENSNTQTQPNPNPVSTGSPTVEELTAKVDELQKQSEGRLRDLQSERQRRSEAEARLSSAPAPSPEPPAPDVNQQDELGKVLKPYIAPIAKQVAEAKEFAQQYHADKAMDFLAAKTGKSRDAILADKELQDRLVSTQRKWGFVGNTYDLTVKAYEAMELENMRTKEVERNRAANAAGTSSITSGTPPPPATSTREYSVTDWENMPLHEYEKLSSNGTFHQNDSGHIVFTPKK